MALPRLLFISLGGTIMMIPTDSGGIAPRLGAALPPGEAYFSGVAWIIDRPRGHT